MSLYFAGAMLMILCGIFGFAFESLSAPAVCVAIGFLIIAAAEISIHWDDIW